MIYLLSQLYANNSIIHIFNYISFRSLLAGSISFTIAIVFGNKFINIISNLNIKQTVRTEGPSRHYTKTGTPTMGGVLIIFSTTITTLLLCDLTNLYLLLLFFVMISSGMLGLYDDYKKAILRNSVGVSAKIKLITQLLITTITIIYIIYIIKIPDFTTIIIPYIKSTTVDIGILLFLILTYFVTIGGANAVNLTDGLDGLVSFPLIINALGLAVFAYAQGNYNFASYLKLPYLIDVQEIVVFCAAIIGSILGFLWYNAYPAKIFMGDVGSLSLGATFATISVLLKQELVWGIMSALFVAEALSVIFQVLSYRYRRQKRIFKMSPLHHHFELSGWSETQTVTRFWIISIIFLVISLLSLKIR